METPVLTPHPPTAGRKCRPPDTSIAPVVDIRGMRKVYYKPDGSVMAEALRGVDVAVHQGDYVAIMGPSGSGKSTLLTLLGCLDRPTDGTFLLGGRDVRTMGDEELSRFRGKTVGFVFQSFNLIMQHTVLENVGVPLFYQGVPPRERERRATEKLALVGLSDRLDHRPMQLSGGQQQRVAVARALVTDPLILLADEPTGNLDSKTGEQILSLFDDLHEKGVTIIMVTHDATVADRCRRIVRLHDGLVESDTVHG